MGQRRKITPEQFTNVVKRALFHKPAESTIPNEDEYEPTQEELDEVVRLDSSPPDEDAAEKKA